MKEEDLDSKCEFQGAVPDMGSSRLAGVAAAAVLALQARLGSAVSGRSVDTRFLSLPPARLKIIVPQFLETYH
jgi:hypothetical protein